MQQPFLADRQSLADALTLIDELGEYAGSEAEARADRSRDKGNLYTFCRWRQIGLMIELLESGGGATLQ